MYETYEPSHDRLKKLEARALETILDPANVIWFDSRDGDVAISIAIDFINEKLVVLDCEYGDRIDISPIELEKI